ncbi:MAG: radical SAM protein [Thermoplasmatota archaeon]
MRGDVSARIRELRAQPLQELLERAWEVRSLNFEPLLGVSAPSPKVYSTASFRNRPGRFANISVTGTGCALRCEHCRGRLLADMIPATTPERLVEVASSLRRRGCTGVLISGGSVEAGYVPLLPFAGAIEQLRGMGLKVIAHTGLIDRRTAIALKNAGVHQVLIDVMGDSRTIREVYHLRRRPSDFRRALLMMRGLGLGLAPHILLGLYYGEIRGEYRALEYVTQARPQALVVIALTRIRGTPMEGVAPPAPGEVARLMAVARIVNPRVPLILGCMRQPGPEKPLLERLAVDAGANALAYPLDETVRHARRRGLRTEFTEECCSLMAERLALR